MFSSQSSPANPPSNPFAQALQKSASAYGPASSSIFSQGSSGWQKPKENPFLKPNPFATTEKPNRLPSPQPSKPPINPFATNGIHSKPAPQPPAESKQSTAGTVENSRPNPFLNGPSSTSSPAQDWTQHDHGFAKPAWLASKGASETQPPTSFKPTPNGKAVNGKAVNGKAVNGNTANGDGYQEKPMFSKNSPGPRSASNSAFSTTLEPKRGENTSQQTPGSQKPRANRRGDVAKTIRDQLAKDGIKPPQWPSNPGSISQRKAVEKFREAYSAYREKAMKSLIRAGLFDDPDTKRRLEDAINFKGICEDMCPDWDKVTRIVQHDVRKEEKEEINGELVASLPLMVTRYSRSSAGQDLPLPMDVRSPAALRRTLDYLITELIPSDNLLPVRHHFLWDRTRAIRREFTFQGSAMNREEKQDFLYCLETITRFHVTALHLLSQPDFAHESFSEQQEIEQLSKTLISLMEAYEDCAKEGIVCENQAEFRGYYIIFNAGDPSLMEKIQSWGPEFLQLEGIKTAICLVQSLQNTWTETGPLMPRAETEMALSMAAMFFSIVASPQISYTMACFAEVHFGSARHAILQTILNGYQRPKNGTKDITPTFLKERLHFDAEEEAIEFAELHQFKFRKGGANQQMMLLPTKSQRKRVPKTRVPHAYSYNIVEHKRGSRSLPDVIHHTVWDEGYAAVTGESQPISPHEASLFVENTPNTHLHEDGIGEVESTVDTAVARLPRPEEEKSTFLSSVSPPSSTFAPSSKQNGLSTAPTPNTQGVQSQNFAPQVNGSMGTAAPLFKKPVESVFNQGGGVKKSQDSTASSATLGAKKTDEKTDAQSSTASSAAPSVFSFLSNKNNAPPAPSTLSQSNLFQFPQIPSTGNATPPASVLSTAASAPSTGPLFPPSSGVFGSIAKPTSTTKSPISLGDATLKPKGSTPSTGGLSVPTGQGSTMSSTSTSPIPPTISSVFPPSTKPLQPTGEPTRSLGSFQPPSMDRASPLSQVQKPDPMDRFTRWYVSGDKGLMETHLEQVVIENLLRTVWDDHLRTEEERKRREEDEKSWAEARKYREYSLSIKYFYKWRDGSRRRRTIKRIQAERDKARQWRLPENVAKREAAARSARESARDKAVEEAKDLIQRKARENAERTYRLNQSTQSNRQSQASEHSQSRQQSREQSIEDALLASGVLDGVHDPQGAARYAAREVKTDSAEDMLPGQQSLLRSQNHRRMRQGLPPLKQMPETKTYKAGSKSAMLRALSSGSGRDSLSMSTGSFRNSTFSSGYRSSLGFNSSRISKTRPKVTDPYWQLKARGLVRMPNGEFLPESLALPMLQEGKRFPGLGDYGLPKEQSISPAQSSPVGDTSSTGYSPSRDLQRRQLTNSPSIGHVFSRRKRIRVDEDEDADADADEGLALAHGREVSGDRKRAKNGSEHDVASGPDDMDFLASIDDLLKQVQDVNRASSQV